MTRSSMPSRSISIGRPRRLRLPRRLFPSSASPLPAASGAITNGDGRSFRSVTRTAACPSGSRGRSAAVVDRVEFAADRKYRYLPSGSNAGPTSCSTGRVTANVCPSSSRHSRMTDVCSVGVQRVGDPLAVRRQVEAADERRAGCDRAPAPASAARSTSTSSFRTFDEHDLVRQPATALRATTRDTSIPSSRRGGSIAVWRLDRQRLPPLVVADGDDRACRRAARSPAGSAPLPARRAAAPARPSGPSWRACRGWSGRAVWPLRVRGVRLEVPARRR